MVGVDVRVLVIVNTRSGGGDAGLYDFVRVLGASGAEITLRFCDGERALEELTVDATRFDRVVAAGGDGTASAVCYSLRNTKVPILVYPAGTANLLAQNLNMPVEPRQLADTTLRGKVVEFDVGELERTDTAGAAEKFGFMLIAGAGYDANIMDGARPLKSTMGEPAYLIAAISNLAPTAAHFRLTLDGEECLTDGIAVLIVNFGRLQFDVPLAAGADPQDGSFAVAVVRPRNVAGLVPAVFASLSGADKLPGIDLYSAKEVTIWSEPELPVQYDGEVTDSKTPVSARALHRATSLLLPHDSPFCR
jgi:diacylglycerol kinase family enzyme